MTVTARELTKSRGTTYLSPFEEMERWFEKAWHDPFGILATTGIEAGTVKGLKLPKVDMYTEGNELVIKADMPGMKKEDVKVDIHDGVLTLSGERKTEQKVEKEDYYSYERSESSFCRSIELPFDTELTKTKARLENGVLEIRLPKTAEVEKKGTEIEIT